MHTVKLTDVQLDVIRKILQAYLLILTKEVANADAVPSSAPADLDVCDVWLALYAIHPADVPDLILSELKKVYPEHPW